MGLEIRVETHSRYGHLGETLEPKESWITREPYSRRAPACAQSLCEEARDVVHHQVGMEYRCRWVLGSGSPTSKVRGKVTSNLCPVLVQLGAGRIIPMFQMFSNVKWCALGTGSLAVCINNHTRDALTFWQPFPKKVGRQGCNPKVSVFLHVCATIRINTLHGTLLPPRPAPTFDAFKRTTFSQP